MLLSADHISASHVPWSNSLHVRFDVFQVAACVLFTGAPPGFVKLIFGNGRGQRLAAVAGLQRFRCGVVAGYIGFPFVAHLLASFSACILNCGNTLPRCRDVGKIGFRLRQTSQVKSLCRRPIRQRVPKHRHTPDVRLAGFDYAVQFKHADAIDNRAKCPPLKPGSRLRP